MKARTLLYVFIFCLQSWGSVLHSQATLNEQIKRVKRALFIFNISDQIQFLDSNENPDFTIGVLGQDRTIIDLRGLSQKRQIKNKPVRVLSFKNIKDIQDVDVVYVNHNKNFDVSYILNKISGNNTLLITEDYPFNTSMVNIVNIGEEFQYEINEDLLNGNNLSATYSLKEHAISSIEKWKQLFQNTEHQLEATQEALELAKDDIKHKNANLSKQKKTINTINSQIHQQKNVLKTQESEINELTTLSEFQKKKYSEKLIIEKQLENRILEQMEALKEKQAFISSNNATITLQQDTLAHQKQEIEAKLEKINLINKSLSTQKTVNYLLLALLIIIVTSVILIYRNYRSIKLLNEDLQEKNNDIFNKSLEIASKNKELEEFAYITSHDLKEPLTTISGLIDLLQDDYRDQLDEDAIISMNFISKSSYRMRNLIDALLNYSRLGKANEKTEINCNTLVSDIIHDLDNAIHRNHAVISYQDLPTVRASEIELRVLFQNLINNAIKFRKSDTSPIINISCGTMVPDHQTQVFWKFEVTDNGIGIKKQHKDKIFAIFQRLHSRETYEGTGIGLAFCKKIVETLGGQIWFESTLNEGTTFFFTIPQQ
ncbi:YfiR/HmsC family protein [Pseudotamlana agarivorans]|uniref:YfiR/HmsC family protein n=1 Tax=Pseudotamlana agarivorans TaxID=481183 RepID=UPI000ABBC803|nr:YfiR/HmsC family protein [Tamlana agarivorans]